MNEKLLCKCFNDFIAHSVIEILESNNIAFRQHDETNAPHIGIYGPTPGIAIYVFEGDYEKALALVAPVVNTPTQSTMPFCPKCGSEDVMHIKRSKYTSHLLILAIFLFIAPMVYLKYTEGGENQFMFYLSILSLVASIVIVMVCHIQESNYRCNHCGKKFHRREG